MSDNRSIRQILDEASTMRVEPGSGPASFNYEKNHGRAVIRAESNTSPFINFEGGISAKDQYDRDSYDYFRPGEKKPTCRKDILRKCEYINSTFGLVQDILSLQTNFTCHGIRIAHPTKRVEKILKAWWDAIGGQSISQKIIHNLNLRGAACITKNIATLNKKQEREFRSTSAIDIVSGYTFLDPAIIEVESGTDAHMLDQKEYFIRIEPKSKAKITAALKDKKYVSRITADKIYLNNEYFHIVHNKKDDWSLWATPILVSIFDDVDMIKKMELADRTIVDGAINKIRFIKLGDVEKNLIPDGPAFNKMMTFLQKNGNGSVTDIVWSEDVSVEETKMEGFEFLGKEKFEPYIEKIFMATGMPILAGSSRGTAQTGTLSLNSLVKRLEFGRNILRDFWLKEFEQLKKELDFKKDVVIEFDYPNLGDESAHKAILIQMADRNLISDEALHYAFNQNPELERIRSLREMKEREDGERVPKTTPYNEGDLESFIIKNLAIKGLIDPKELGIDVKIKEETNQITNPISPGRPKNSVDTEPRKRRAFKAASYLSSAELLEDVTEFVKPLVLKTFNRKNLRELSNDETAFYEDIRISFLFNIKNKSEITEAKFLEIVEQDSSPLFREYKDVCHELAIKQGQLTFDQKNKIASIIHYEVL